MDCMDCKQEMDVESYLTLQITHRKEVVLEADIPLCASCLLMRESDLHKRDANAL